MRDAIVVIGTTGVGKSQLAIDLAVALRNNDGRRGEVVNADSMQVYRGLDIITNKATTEEMQGVPHHLMGFLDPGDDYRVDRFRKDAIQKISELHANGSLPIVVGGTMYFLQNLLFPGKLVSAEDVSASATSNPKGLHELDLWLRAAVESLPPALQDVLFVIQDLPNISTPDGFAADFPVHRLPQEYREAEKLSMGLHVALQAIDPDMAARWHWRDIRKVRRSVEVALQTGKRHSQIMLEQKELLPEAEFRTLVFWLYAQPEVLEPRLDSRVDKMVERGLLDEIITLRRIAQKHKHIDMSQGIYQSIGYKEFASYFDTAEGDQGNSNLQSKLFQEAIAATQTATRQYARRQVKWIKSKFLPAARTLHEDDTQRDNMHVYCLDASDLSRWQPHIQDTAIRIARDFLDQRPMEDPHNLGPVAAAMLSAPNTSKEALLRARKVRCEVCTTDPAQPVMVDEGDGETLHNQSRGHRKRMQRLNREKSRQAMNAAIDETGASTGDAIPVSDLQSAMSKPG